MELNEIVRVLEENFNKELTDGKKRNIVFWYDDEGEFEKEINELKLSNAKILILNENNSFQIKYQIEKEDTESNYLIYAPFGKPGPRENWLLDIQKYSIDFSTDKATVIMRDLNINEDNLRPILREYLKFFNNKERYKLFKSYEIEQYTEEKIHIAILSTLCRLSFSDIEGVVRTLLTEYAENKENSIEAIEKFGKIEAMWGLLEKYYGYNLQEKSIEHLSLFFTLTGLSYTFKDKFPKQWEKYISSKKGDCIVFLSNFMNNSQTSKVYNAIAQLVEVKINLKEYLSKWDVESYEESDIFESFDTRIIENLNKNLVQDIGEFNKYKELILDRRVKHWFKNFEYEYNCVFWACSLLEYWKQLKESVKEYSPYDFFIKYSKEFYNIDTAYRKFIYSYDRLVNKEWMMELKEKVENTYINGFVNSLSIKWSNSIEGLSENWNISTLTQQKDFHKTYIKPHMEKGERVFVIISDGLRYEAGKEFAEILNTERKGSTEVFAMQGSLPSYTKLGMASLLPNRSIEINEKYEISVDGVSIEGTENRNKILNRATEKSIAIQYKDLNDMKRDDFRRTFSGKDLIYIYHNSIDARGDHQATEREVFDAVEEAFEQLKSLISNLINNVTATNIYIVSDHGFIYKRGSIKASDKITKESIADAYENRRFILTHNKDESMEGTLEFNMKYLFEKDTTLKCITPRGANRFKVQGGGANYVHGGASLQEIVIPVIKFKNERGKSGKEVKKVDVKLTSISRKITNSITFMEFFQTEKVGDKIIPNRLKLYMVDEEGNRTSNENIIIADIKSDNPNERTFKEKFVLKNMKYDKSKKYYLIFEDEEQTVEKIYDKIPFIVDIAFSNDDFGF